MPVFISNQAGPSTAKAACIAPALRLKPPPMTREELERRMDELARQYAHELVKAELEALSLKLMGLLMH